MQRTPEPELMTGAEQVAAYRPEELAAQLDAVGLSHLRVEQVSDRHLMVWGPLSGSRGS